MLSFPRNSNAIDHYWVQRLGEPFVSSSSEILQSILQVNEIPYNWELTLAHKTALKLNSLDLGDVLGSLSSKEIDARDRFGRTALWWAVMRNDVSTLNMLIQKGANVNIESTAGTSPLNLASRRSHACVPALLRAGAVLPMPDGVDRRDSTKAAYYHCPSEVLKQILHHSSEFNGANTDRDAIPVSAAQEGLKTACGYLISRNTNTDGECALHRAILEKHPETIRLLLIHDAPHHLKTKVGESLLHYAAMHGDESCLDALQSFDLKGIQSEDLITGRSSTQISKDVVGCTAAQIAEQRSDVTLEWREAFRRLMQAIKAGHDDDDSGKGTTEPRNPTINIERDTAGDVEDINMFEDALEYQVP